MAAALQAKLQEAEAAPPAQAVSLLREVVTDAGANDAEALKVKEAALGRLADALVKAGDAAALRSLLYDLRGLFAVIPKAKTAKIVRTIIDSIAKVPGSTQLLVRGRRGSRGGTDCAAACPHCPCTTLVPHRLPQKEVCTEQVEWARAEKRAFLRQRIEIRLAQLHMELRDYPAALGLIGGCSARGCCVLSCGGGLWRWLWGCREAACRSRASSGRRQAGRQLARVCSVLRCALTLPCPPLDTRTAGKLLTEVKRLDDKLLLVDIHLLESKVWGVVVWVGGGGDGQVDSVQAGAAARRQTHRRRPPAPHPPGAPRAEEPAQEPRRADRGAHRRQRHLHPALAAGAPCWRRWAGQEVLPRLLKGRRRRLRCPLTRPPAPSLHLPLPPDAQADIDQQSGTLHAGAAAGRRRAGRSGGGGGRACLASLLLTPAVVPAFTTAPPLLPSH